MAVRYEEIEHTADVGIRAYGSTLNELFANTAEGMFSLIADLDSVKPVGEIEVRLAAEDISTLMLRWLSELLYIHETQRLLLAAFDVQLDGVGRDSGTIDGRDVTARDRERIRAVVDVIRGRASLSQPFRMASVNDFPSNIGLGASASGFAALATAAAHATGLRLPPEEISRFARRGAGSASRSVTGGVSKREKALTADESYAVPPAGGDLPRARAVPP